MRKPLFIVLAIDERLADIDRCIVSLRLIYGAHVEAALATYGGPLIRQQPLCEDYAQRNGLQHVYIDKQEWLTAEDLREWHCAEMQARIQITRRFMDEHDEIYILHSDVVFTGDVMRVFNKIRKRRKQWSFIGAVVYSDTPFNILCDRGGWRVYFDGDRARFADIVTRYNPAFIEYLYSKYGTDRGMWEGLLKQWTLWGDLSTFDLARDIKGFRGLTVNEKYVSDKNLFNGTVSHLPRNAFPKFLKKGMLGNEREQFLKNMIRRGGKILCCDG